MTKTLRFWGVRGSIPSPGIGTLGVGGKTSWLELHLGGEVIILDGGSGLRQLGLSLAGRHDVRATLCIGHLHWDHVQGIPFFGPPSRLGTGSA